MTTICLHLNSEVIDSRPITYNGKSCTKRRRRCRTCQLRYTTLEVAEEDIKPQTMKMARLLKSLIKLTNKIIEELERGKN